jgi:hypothetical protein
VPDVVVRQNGIPSDFANFVSKSRTTVPLVQFKVPDAMTFLR